jgi:hypothetical protein
MIVNHLREAVEQMSVIERSWMFELERRARGWAILNDEDKLEKSSRNGSTLLQAIRESAL